MMSQRSRWAGSRAGVKMSFFYNPQPDFEGKRVEWKAHLNGAWQRGRTATVYDAIEEIEEAAAQ